MLAPRLNVLRSEPSRGPAATARAPWPDATLAPMDEQSPAPSAAPAVTEVERLLLQVWIDAGDEVALRREDLKKAREVAALLGQLPAGRGRLVVDAAAGHGYVG